MGEILLPKAIFLRLQITPIVLSLLVIPVSNGTNKNGTPCIPLYSPDPWEFGSLQMRKANSNFNSETNTKMLRISNFIFQIYENKSHLVVIF